MTIIIVILLAIAAILCFMLFGGESPIIDLGKPPVTVERGEPVITYGNDEVNADADETNDTNFGKNRWVLFGQAERLLSQTAFGGFTNEQLFGLDAKSMKELSEQHPEDYAAWKAELVKSNNDLVSYNLYSYEQEDETTGEKVVVVFAAPTVKKFISEADWGVQNVFQTIFPVYEVDTIENQRGSDPALAAALVVDAYYNYKQDDFLPPEIRSLDKGTRESRTEMINALHLRFRENSDFQDELVGKYYEYVMSEGTFEMEEVTSYKSSMYMKNCGLNGQWPKTVVANTSGRKTSHILKITTKDGVQLLRFECGWQPINVWWWETPDKPTDPTNPSIIIDIDEDEDPTNPSIIIEIDDDDPWPKDPSKSSEENPRVSNEAKPNPGNTNNTVNNDYGNGLDNSNPNGYQPSEEDNRRTQREAEELADQQHRDAEAEYNSRTGANTSTPADDPIIVDNGNTDHGAINDNSNQDADSGKSTESGGAGEDLSGDWF